MGANEKLGAAMHGATPHERAIIAVRGVREQNAYDEDDQMYTQGWNDALREVEHRITATLEQS